MGASYFPFLPAHSISTISGMTFPVAWRMATLKLAQYSYTFSAHESAVGAGMICLT